MQLDNGVFLTKYEEVLPGAILLLNSEPSCLAILLASISILKHCLLPHADFPCVFTPCSADKQRWVMTKTGIRLNKGHVGV
jgi:hypothetical protein